MAYDERLANAIWHILEDEPELTEKPMFGGLAFLIGGKIAVAARNDGALMVRVGPDDHGSALTEPGAIETRMGGRLMRGWITVDPQVCTEPEVLRAWVHRGLAYTKALPPKR